MTCPFTIILIVESVFSFQTFSIIFITLTTTLSAHLTNISVCVCVCVKEKEGSLCPQSQAYKTSAECLQFINTSLMSLSGESKWSALISSQIPLTSANVCVRMTFSWMTGGLPNTTGCKEREKVWTTHSRSQSTNPFSVSIDASQLLVEPNYI